MAQRKIHLFVLDPIERLNLAWDTSIKTAFCLSHCGYDVYFCTGRDLSRTMHPVDAQCVARKVTFGQRSTELVFDKEQKISLTAFSAIHMRREPPFDMDYISSLWILDSVSEQVPIFNAPKSLLEINEKLAILDFPIFTKPAIVSSNPAEIFEFAKERCQSNIVVKPLGMYGGRGVEHIEAEKGQSEKVMLEKLHLATLNGKETRMVQAFDPSVHNGEVRAFTAGGKAIVWCLKIPREGEFLANTRAGSVLQTYKPTEREQDVAAGVAETLLKRGVVFAGIDMIDGWLSEVNITCPAVLYPDRASLNGFDAIVSVIEQRL